MNDRMSIHSMNGVLAKEPTGAQTAHEILNSVLAFYEWREPEGDSATATADRPAVIPKHGHNWASPSLPRGLPNKPMTAGEVDAFLKALRRTSFRRSSASFRGWAKRMGIGLDPEPPEEPQDPRPRA
ncbi:MAG: hypothetical protein LC118_13245 [Dehalococcoidia bacterium]|nr:hypothetical protein [Dehalococcoidia bacterium]